MKTNRTIEMCLMLAILSFSNSVFALKGKLDNNDAVLKLGKQRYASVSLYAKGSSSNCSGVLISKDIVLTAAHCLTLLNVRPQDFEVRFTELRESSQFSSIGTIYTVEDGQAHPEYSDAIMGSPDIAVLKLKNPYPYSEGVIEKGMVEPINILAQENEINATADFAISGSGQKNYGWGKTRLASDIDLTKLAARLEVAQDAFKNFAALSGGRVDDVSGVINNMLNKNGTGSDLFLDVADSSMAYPCPGDSGGPLVLKKDNKVFLVGLDSHRYYKNRPEASSNYECETQNFHSYTNVQYHLPWIINAIKILSN